MLAFSGRVMLFRTAVGMIFFFFLQCVDNGARFAYAYFSHKLYTAVTAAGSAGCIYVLGVLLCGRANQPKTLIAQECL